MVTYSRVWEDWIIKPAWRFKGLKVRGTAVQQGQLVNLSLRAHKHTAHNRCAMRYIGAGTHSHTSASLSLWGLWLPFSLNLNDNLPKPRINLISIHAFTLKFNDKVSVVQPKCLHNKGSPSRLGLHKNRKTSTHMRAPLDFWQLKKKTDITIFLLLSISSPWTPFPLLISVSLTNFTCNEHRITAEHITEHLPSQWLGITLSDGHNVKWRGLRSPGPIVFSLITSRRANLIIRDLILWLFEKLFELNDWMKKKVNLTL